MPAFPDPSSPTLHPDAAYAEAVATQRLFNAWQLLGGRFPWLTLLVLLVSVVVTGLSFFQREVIYELFAPTGYDVWVLGHWHGLLTAIFLHGDIIHLLFNCSWIWLFGRLLEKELGVVRTFGLFLAGAWIGSVAELAVSGQVGIGLSGVVYALFGVLLVNREQRPDFGRILPARIIKLMLIWLVACFFLTHFKILRVANFAHLGGFIVGCMAGAVLFPGRWRVPAALGCIVLTVTSFVPLYWAPWQEAWHVARAFRALEQKDLETALPALEELRRAFPANTWALFRLAAARESRGEFAQARDALDQAVRRGSDVTALNALAWLLATCPAAEVRDGKRAVALARQACELTQWKQAAILDTLAAALAEAGDFPAAIKNAEQALALDPRNAADYQPHLEAFRAGQPWREPKR